MRVRNKINGDVYELVAYGAGKYVTEFAVERKDGSTVAVYDTVEDLHGYWETYLPKEPLIKDEKIRKAVRAWAEACNADSVFYRKENDSLNASGCVDVRISFLDFALLELKEKTYTIAELCGEEEE